ncbi:MAG: hypothetical protein ACI8QC_003558 [Planctomycetota bacterium]|jgi:hypothetical protein
MRVISHNSRAHALTTPPRTSALLGFVLLIAGFAACSDTPETAPGDVERDAWGIPVDAPITDDARRMAGNLMDAMRPLDATLTSDHHDRHLFKQRRIFQEMLVRGEEVGNAALHAYTGAADEPYLVRRALLWVGGHAAPDSARNLLHALMVDYGAPIDDRTEASLVLAETSPELFLSAASGHLRRRSRPTKTMPDDEFLVEGWIAACAGTDQSPVPMLADVATNLLIQPTARYRAAKRLRDFANEPVGQRALEACLVESTGDNYLRRMAAQSLQSLLPRETACSLFSEILRRESDMNFARFIDDMLQKHCRADDQDELGRAQDVGKSDESPK